MDQVFSDDTTGKKFQKLTVQGVLHPNIFSITIHQYPPLM